MDRVDVMLENGPWFICNTPFILRSLDVNLLKEDVGNVLVWVKFHGVPMTTFSEDGLSVIATKFGTPLILDTYTSHMDERASISRHTCGDSPKIGNVPTVIASTAELVTSNTKGLESLLIIKRNVGNVLVWVKLHGVPMTAFSEDDLSAIATILGTPLILDSYTFDMCIQSWGRSSFARAMIEHRADVELKDTIMAAMPKLVGEGFYMCTIRVEYKWKPPKCSSCNLVIISDVVKNLKTPRQTARGVQVSNLNPFDALNFVEYDDDLGTDGENSNSDGKWTLNVARGSSSNTPIIEKIDTLERQILDGKL
ncbi:hypothetical protein Tco_1147988, partial [Tanacetum coccineum]